MPKETKQTSSMSKIKSKKDPTTRKKKNRDADDEANLNGGLDEIESLFCQRKKAKIEKKVESKQKARSVNRKHATSEPNISSSQYWFDDGLGGKFNTEGYTGRSRDGCRVFKAHVLNKPNSGNTKDCPFDCDCCFI